MASAQTDNLYDDDFMTLLVKKYANAVYGTAYHIVGSFDLAQDLAQETFIKAYLNMDKLKDPEKAGSWLYSIVRNISVDYLRKRRQNEIKLDENINSDETLEDKIESNEIKGRVKDALNTLTDNGRLTAILCYIDGYTAKEVSSYLGISVEAVESRLKRARKQLKKEMLDMVENELQGNKLGSDFSSKMEGILKEIATLQKVGKQREVLTEAEKYIKEYPQNDTLKLIHANALSTVGNSEDNMDLLNKAEKEFLDLLKGKQPPDIKVQTYIIGLAYNYMNMKEYDKAIEYFEKLSIDGIMGKAIVLKRQGKSDEALKISQIYAANKLLELSLAISNLTKMSISAKDKKMAYLYCKLNIDMLEATGREYMILSDLRNAYMDLAKLKLKDSFIDDCIDSLRLAQGVAYKKCVSDFGESNLFNLCVKEFMESQNMEGTPLEWFLNDIKNKPFDGLKGNDKYEKLIKDTEEKINEVKNLKNK